MVKIIIPSWAPIGELEFELEQNELVLLKDDQTPKLGLFVEIKKGRHYPYLEEFILRNTFSLHKSSKVIGGICPALTSYVGDYNMSFRKLREIAVGQEDIIKLLTLWNGFEPHLECVAKLRKPY